MRDTVQTIELPERVSRLLVLGDPHGALEATRAVFEKELDGRTQACCVGDVVGYADGPSSSALAEFLKSRGVPTVEGNHEAWVAPGGTLAIVDAHVSSRQLTPATVEWIATLPATIEFTRSGGQDRLAVMVHSIRDPGWDWINAENAPGVIERVGSPRVVLSGHSHRPKFIVSAPSGECVTKPFDFLSLPEMTLDLPADGSVLVDAGSLGRAAVEGSISDGHERTGRFRYGSYAIIDFQKDAATLRRHEHS